MKKKLLIFAVAGFALASCSSDETTASLATSEANEISFRPLVNGVTRAAQKDSWVTDDVLDVFAEYKVGSAAAKKYFQANFTKQSGGNFTSAAKYYWPAMSGNTMTFTAVYGPAQSTTTAGSLASVYTPNASAASQTDIMYARKEVSESPEAPVALNFRHMLSQIDVKVKNTNASLEFDITGVRIGYVKTSGSFACTSITTTANENLGQDTWTPTAFPTDAEDVKVIANTHKYEVTGLTKNISGSVDAATQIGSFSTWMLVPQDVTKASDYTVRESGSASDDPKLNGAYVAIKMNIKNALTDDVIVAEQWCYWPIPTGSWNPGYKYTYLVDLAGGGYQPTDKNSTAGLDAVLGTPIEMSASCTIDDWDTESNTSVPM